MKPRQSMRRGRCAMYAACGALSFSGQVFATSPAPSFNTTNSTVKITHYAQENNAAAYSDKNVNPPPVSGSMPTPGSYQYSKTLNLNSGSSSAAASVGAITTAADVGFTFASGTGLTQTDPTNSIGGPALLKFNLNGEWDITNAAGYGPSYGYLAFTAGGVIPTGDTASITIDMSWTDKNGNPLRTPITNQITSLTHASPTANILSASLLNGGAILPMNQKVFVTGTISFRASDPGATISLTPQDFELSAAPPTYTFNSAGSTANTSSAANWINDMGLPVPVPNSPGVRAYFGSVGAGSESAIVVDQPMTLGMVDIDRPGVTVQGNAPVTFDSGTPGIDAVLFDRNVNDTGKIGTVFAVPVILNSPLEVVLDQAGSFNDGGAISGAGGIVKEGNGNLVLNNSNSFTGGIAVDAGTITAMAPGSLGNGTVTIGGGMINVMTPNPFSGSGGTILVQSNSQVMVGTFGGNVNYNVGTLGCISGSATQLQSLVIGSNFFPSTGAVISHQTFDTTPASGNPGGLPNVPTYIFGVSNDFTVAGDNITVGSGSSSPWLGFGSDIQPRTFGTLGNGQTLGVSGHAQLVALGSILAINAKVTGGAADSISKQGAGLVVINSASSFTGSTSVDSGPLAINGTWNGPITITSGATLGGSGTTTSTLSFQAGSTFQPGVGAADNNATGTGNQPVTPGGHTFHSGPANFSSTTHILYDLNTPNVVGGADNDLLMVTGNISLASAILDINGGVDFSNGTYTLMEATGTITGSLTPGSIPLDDFPGMQIQVINGAGGGQVLLSVPEPATAALLATIGATLLTARRSRPRRPLSRHRE